jgi:integrase
VGQKVHWDSGLKGFGVRIGTGSKSFVVQKSGKGIKTIGRYGVLTVSQARQRAQDILGDIVNERLGKTPRLTLRKAMHGYVEGMENRGRAPLSIAELEYRLENYLADWLDRPLANITRTEVRERHKRIGKKNGPYIANGVFRHFRAIYYDALAQHDGLPSNPCVALRNRWFKETRRQEPIQDLREWWLSVMRLSPVRRSYQLFVLLTGLRRSDAATMRWEDIDFEIGTLHRPIPKGGESRAFSIPLSRVAIGILRHRKRQNEILYPGSPWVFPAASKSGHIVEPKEQRQIGGKKVAILPSPHRLRDTYTTACVEADLSPYDIDVLTNPRPPKGTVTAGYIRQNVDHLQKCQEKVTCHLLESVRKR